MCARFGCRHRDVQTLRDLGHRHAVDVVQDDHGTVVPGRYLGGRQLSGHGVLPPRLGAVKQQLNNSRLSTVGGWCSSSRRGSDAVRDGGSSSERP